MQTATQFAYERAVSEICALPWAMLDEAQIVALAWAYYFFSVQFRENLQIACALFPEDEKLRELETEECDTDNLSPWPGVAQAGARMNHDEFMKRSLALAPIPEALRRRFEASGNRYLSRIRTIDPMTRALSISSYEDGGLERVFRAMLTSPPHDSPLSGAFRHFLSEHVKFDSDPGQGHGAMIRHLRPDDRILPLWVSFKELLIEFVPALSRSDGNRPHPVVAAPADMAFSRQ